MKLYIYAILACTLMSCTAPIDINTRDSEPVIVIYGCLTDEHKHQYVRVTRSSPYFEDKANPVVADADVYISDSEGNGYALEYGEEGYYFSKTPFAVRPGITYHLAVDVDFDGDGVRELYEAETTVLPAIPLDSIDVRPMTIMGYRHFSLNIYAQDPEEERNFYLFKFFVNDSISNDRVSRFLITDDEFFNGSAIESNLYYFDDFTDERVVERNKDNDNAYMVSPGDRILLQTISIEEGYYHFINQAASEMRGENPMFGGPPSNITTNITNGAVGFFTGYCIHESHTTVP